MRLHFQSYQVLILTSGMKKLSVSVIFFQSYQVLILTMHKFASNEDYDSFNPIKF